MSTTTPTIKAKIAKVIYNSITDTVIKASTHPIFCKLNLHNNRVLKTINSKAFVAYKLAYHSDDLIKAPYDRGGETNVENALLAIQSLIRSGGLYNNNKEFILKRIDYLVNEGLGSLYDQNHQDWMKRIQSAIHSVKLQRSTRSTKKTTGPLRDKKGRFVKTKKRK
jgi:hypothetical protein